MPPTFAEMSRNVTNPAVILPVKKVYPPFGGLLSSSTRGITVVVGINGGLGEDENGANVVIDVSVMEYSSPNIFEKRKSTSSACTRQGALTATTILSKKAPVLEMKTTSLRRTSTNNERVGSWLITYPQPPLSTTVGSDPSLSLISNQNFDIEEVALMVALKKYRVAATPCACPIIEKSIG